MRMEELDVCDHYPFEFFLGVHTRWWFQVIKKRQPTSSSQDKIRKRLRRSTIQPPSPPTPTTLALPQGSKTPDSLPTTTPPLPPESADDGKLVSFVDMLFGGKLTSILVCEKCKHISQTHEDFNDLSLSIKPDDYGKHRKRGRFKAFAKRVAALPSTALSVNLSEKHRSSSVPPSPREAAGLAGGIDEPPIVDDLRRRSLDVLADAGSIVAKETDSSTREPSPEGEHAQSSTTEDASISEESKHVEFGENVKAEKKGKKDKDDEGWAKLGRRISMSIRLGKDKEQSGRSKARHSVIGIVQPDARNSTSSSKEIEVAPSHSIPSTPPSRASDNSGQLHDPVTPPQADIQSPQATPKVQSRHSYSGARLSSPPLLSQPSLSSSRIPTIQHFTHRRPRSSLPPKPTPEETAYLRQVLADITPTSSNPFTIFRQNGQYGTNGVTPSSASSAYALWLKMGQLPGIEECLRMFTAVEILDGENMVGCRRCWKIENGLYKPQYPNGGGRKEDDSDSGGDNVDDVEGQQAAPEIKQPSPLLAPASQPFSWNAASLSSPTISTYAHTINSDAISKSSPTTRETTPFSSSSVLEPLIFQTDTSPGSYESLPSPPIPHETVAPLPPGARPPVSPHTLNILEHAEAPPLGHRTVSIPLISTTAPDSPTFTPLEDLPNPNHDALQSLQRPGTPSADSLRTPRVYHRRPKESDFFDGTCESSEADSDASTGGSVFDQSGSSSPSLLQPDLPTEQNARHSKESSSSSSKVSRSKEVVMRAAYKRYLIGTPPPVLVIHLKRFQQISKTYMMSFSHGLKKLDDYVTFPEYLDLTPFLAPKKEDFGLGSKKLSIRLRSKDKERCMYRLYAVVVHIGNMVCSFFMIANQAVFSRMNLQLGGHYVAYTALPTDPPIRSSQTVSSSPPNNEPGPNTSNANIRAPRRWAYISDTVVRLTTIEEVLKVKAYICMYERI